MEKKQLLIAAALFAVVSCAQSPADKDLTRGAGIYPGSPQEYSGPSMETDCGTYRNIAIHRVAYTSSNIDYNLTGHLATDGIITDELPCLIKVKSGEGYYEKRIQEKIFDDVRHSVLPVNGGNGTFIELQMINGSIDAESVVAEGQINVSDGNPGNCKLSMDVSKDGKEWRTIGNVKVRKSLFQVAFDLPADAAISFVRLTLNCPDAEGWVLSEMNFIKDGKETSILPSHKFTSVWMSESGENEWIYVDFGAKATFDKVRLHWVNKAIEGCIETSGDAKVWKKIAELPGGSSPVDEINVKGSGRYLRISAGKSACPGSFILSEIEVFGKGGTKAVAKKQAEASGNRLYLTGGNWKLQRAPEVEADGYEISSGGFDTSDWITATVPASAVSSYYNIGAIADINHDDDQLQISESYFLSDFWYRDSFVIPEEFKGKDIILNFDGINWKADVYFNGNYTGRIDGAFIRGHFNVTGLAKVGEENTLAVYIYKNDHPGVIKEQNAITTDNNGGILGADNPTFHCTVGWDWIPTVRGRNVGIWNDVFLSAYQGGVSISDVYVKTDLPLPDTSHADLYATVSLVNYSSETKTAGISLDYGGKTITSEATLQAGESRDVELPVILFDNPQLWWPAGYGEQHLYEVKTTVSVDGCISDTKVQKSGIREMSYDTSKGHLEIFINGRRLIANGGNWGFPEINLNYRAREYDIAVAYHADMNYTIIRNWVGQTGDEEFYEACDRHGVMIWQDFWLANPWDGPDPYDNSMFMANAEDYVKKIRHHASVALYCGRNEGNPPAELDNALRNMVGKYHPEIYYISHSSRGLVSGEGPYRALEPDEYFKLEKGRNFLHSERGMPNVMSYESMALMLDEENHWPQNNVWGMHDYTLESAQSAATFNALMENGFGKAESMKQFAETAQWINYNGYRALYESRSWNRQGIIIWMSHSSWPSMVWQTYDYYFEPTAAYFAIKKASAPIRIQWNPVSGYVEVVNNNALDRTGLTAYAAILTADGKVLYENEVTLDSNEDSTVDAMPLTFEQEGLTDTYFIKLKLIQDGSIIADNFYWEGREKGNYQLLNSLPNTRVSLKYDTEKTVDGYRITAKLCNTGNVPALMLRLKTEGRKSGERILPCFYEDNYFSLLAGESKTVVITVKKEDCHGEMPVLCLSGFNVKS